MQLFKMKIKLLNEWHQTKISIIHVSINYVKNHLKYIMLKQYLPSQQNLSHHAVISFFYYAFHTLVILQNIAMQIYIIRKYILTNESMSYKRKLMKIAKNWINISENKSEMK